MSRLLVDGILRRAARLAPGAVATSVGGRSATYGDIDRAASRWANWLKGAGAGGGDRVAWWSPSSLDAVGAFWGCARAGVVFCPLNPALTESEALTAVEYLGPRLLVADGGRADAATAVTDALDVRSVRLGGPLDDALAAASPSAPTAPVGDDSAHAVFLTSGSTGRPKGVVLSHRASWLRAFPGGGTFSTNGQGGMLTAFPQFHWAWWHYVMEAAHGLRALHLVSSTDGPAIVAGVERWRPTWMYLIPALWERVLACPAHTGDLTSLRQADTGTSAFSASLLEGIKARLPGTTTSVFYGSTEAGRLAVLGDEDLFRKAGTVGRPAPPVEAEVGADGELRVRNPFLMSGYLDLPDETSRVLRHGWYLTGDTASLDDEGYLTITGRVAETIRSGGETVAPAEVELALRTHPGVREVAVVGLPDDEWGELVCAVLVVDGDTPRPDLASVRHHLGPLLARYKHPRRLLFAERLPRTPATGQLQRRMIRDWAVSASQHEEATC
ncbi:MAG TPA: class I adenylate-forming enzyme family protein [Acidimicrobiales bacterium]|nr:class I adenylate-forming enzyme family protein [Acidimicrobiales bacterium]